MAFELTGVLKHETDAALCVFDFATEEEIWLPLSQVDKITRMADNVIEIRMTDWIAKKKGLL